jgi:hypothetical protein
MSKMNTDYFAAMIKLIKKLQPAVITNFDNKGKQNFEGASSE